MVQEIGEEGRIVQVDAHSTGSDMLKTNLFPPSIIDENIIISVR